MAKRKSLKRYPAASIARALELYAGGVLMRTICSKTAADPKTVRRWAREAGLALRGPGRPTTHDHQRILEERARLGSDAATAAVVGCDPTTVLRVRRRTS